MRRECMVDRPRKPDSREGKGESTYRVCGVITYRAPREYPILVRHAGLPPLRGRRRAALDVGIKPRDDVPRRRGFEILGLFGEDEFFDVGLSRSALIRTTVLLIVSK
jgi:hypothetical protein